MHLQENTLYDLDLGVKVTYNVAQYSPHHVIYAPAKFEVAKSNRLGEEALTRKYIIWPWPWGQGHTKHRPINHVINASTKFVVAMSNGLGEDAFTRKYIIWPFDLDPKVKVIWSVAKYPLHHVTYAPAKFEVAMFNSLEGGEFTRKYIIWSLQHETSPNPSTSCDLCIYKVWSCYILRFRRRYNYKIRDWQTEGRTTDLLWYENNIPYFSKEKAGITKQAIIIICPIQYFEAYLLKKVCLKIPCSEITLNTFNHVFRSFDWILYIPVNNFSVMWGQVFLGCTSTKQGLMCPCSRTPCCDADEAWTSNP